MTTLHLTNARIIDPMCCDFGGRRYVRAGGLARPKGTTLLAE